MCSKLLNSILWLYVVWTWFYWLHLWFVTCYFTLVEFVPFHFVSYGFQLFSTATLFNMMLLFVMIWIDTWRYTFIMDYSIMKLDVVHTSLNLVFLTATSFVTFTLLYLSLSPLILPHLGCPCSRLQLEPTWYYCVILRWFFTWRCNFIMGYEIMKLCVGY